MRLSPSPIRLSRAALIGGGYAVLTWVFLFCFVDGRGLVGETSWIELSQTRPGIAGFIYPYDASRRLLSVPFHLAYLTSDGSYRSLHVVNALLVFLTGVLTCLLVRIATSVPLAVCFAAGAIALVCGADKSVAVMSMMQVRQSVVAALVAIVCLTRGWMTGQPWWLFPAAIAQATALWTYEPALPVLAAAAVLLGRGPTPRVVAWGAGWLAVPTCYLVLLALRYASGGSSYQAGRLIARTPSELLSTLFGLLADGLAFWRWPVDWWRTYLLTCQAATAGRMAIPLAVGLVSFVVCSVTLWRRAHGGEKDVSRWTFAIVLFFLLAAYLPFLAIDLASPGQPTPGAWRAHYFAAVPAGVLLAMLAYRASRLVRWTGSVATLLGAAIVAAGLVAGMAAQLEASRKWSEYRRVTAAIVESAPRIADDTFVALLDVPAPIVLSACEPSPPTDPFNDTMWFNSALQVFYPGTRLAGSYWLETGETRGAVIYRVQGDTIALERTAVSVEGERFGVDQLIAFRYDPRAGAVLLRSLPDSFMHGDSARGYAPLARITPGEAPPETRRKLNLD
jgi:hypothetical protein